MINLSLLNKTKLIFYFFLLISNFAYAVDEPVDIWSENSETGDVKIESPIKKQKKIIIETTSEETKIQITAEEIELSNDTLVGLFDPESNSLDMNIWIESDGKDIKQVLTRIAKLNLSVFSEDLLFNILFTSAYPPKKNLSSDEFLDIKINWLIKNERVEDLEKLILLNSNAGKKEKAVKYLIEEYISSANISSACKKIENLDKSVENDYLEKFKIYCLVNDGRKEEAQLMLDLLLERGFKNNFFVEKINFLTGITNKSSNKIVDENVFDFFLSQITSDNFVYNPTDKTSKFIWRYLSSANLLSIDDLEDEETIINYEKAAAANSFEKKDLFEIYKKILFSVNQLINVTDVYKNLPGYKSRALIYQTILLSDNVEKKLKLTFLLKDLFDEEKISNAFSEELSKILNSINPDEIPEGYEKIVKKYRDIDEKEKKIQFDNEIIHQSKILKYFIEENYEIKKLEKDFKSVYKKVKRNKKYFISIKDIIILESLKNDGIDLPGDLKLQELASKLTVPQGLDDLASEQQVGLVMLKIVEIVGEDDINSLDPETIYFLNKILNKLNLKKIRNNIIVKTIPARA